MDERAGTFAGVGIGDRPAAVERVFGERTPETGEGIAPRGQEFVEIGGPTLVSVPTPCRGRRRTGPPVLRYEDVSFLTCAGRVYAVIVAEADARTARGVAIGEGLDEARRAYPELRCGDAVGGEALFGGTNTYPYCAARLGNERWLWFGEDPIRSITVSEAPLRT